MVFVRRWQWGYTDDLHRQCYCDGCCQGDAEGEVGPHGGAPVRLVQAITRAGRSLAPGAEGVKPAVAHARHGRGRLSACIAGTGGLRRGM